MATPHAAANRMLVTEPERCTGCGFCEMACAITQDHTCDPGRSRVRIIEWKDDDRYLPVTCQHCEEAPCMKVCPREAIHRDSVLERVIIDYDLCISCRMCASACPYGAIGFNDKRGRVFKCDLCEGDPQCVRFCFPQALQYVVSHNLQASTRRMAARRNAFPFRNKVDEEI